MCTTVWLLLLSTSAVAADPPPVRKTEVEIRGDQFFINGEPTYKGRTWNGQKIEGLLMNSRMVQGIFDDLNPETVSRWAYPDTKRWYADRNTREFVAAMPEWRRHGLLAFTLNLQGGSPTGYSKDQPWHNSAFTADGSLRPAYLKRLETILDKADEQGMVVILGLFYFGQDERLKDEEAVKKGVDNALDWLFAKGYRNVLIEVNNECNVRYDHAILRPDRVHELIEQVKGKSKGGRRFLAGTSYGGGTIPKENVVKSSDFLLLHGNGVKDPARIAAMVRQTRQVGGYHPMPILFNEDDHFDFDKPTNNFAAAIGEYASWGYFDYRMAGEGFDDGYQSVPVNWGISSMRKKAFFKLLSEITGDREIVAKLDDLSQLPTTHGFKVYPYLKAAQSLQAMGKEKAGALLRDLATRELSRREWPYTRTITLCRMLFQAKPNSNFRRAYVGAPFYFDGRTSKDWPQEPITIVDGVPFLVAESYILAGMPESPIRYVDFCLSDCDWADYRYESQSRKQQQKAMDKLLSGLKMSERLRNHAREFLETQISGE
jgi:hypothetical protein